MDLANLSSNWKKLQATITTEPTTTISRSQNDVTKRKRLHSAPNAVQTARKRAKGSSQPSQRSQKLKEMETVVKNSPSVENTINAGLSPSIEVGKYVALDCEMVGVGPFLADGTTESALARVSIVNYNGDQVYDSFVLPKEAVTDWRTAVSGIKPLHMKSARTFEDVQTAVSEILKDRIVVGHALRHDFKALLLDHPMRDIRDTSRHAPYKKIAGGTPKLSLLASELLGLEIQTGEHSSLEDARACMLLFRRDKDSFETKRMNGRQR